VTRQPKKYFFEISNVVELIYFYSRTSFESLSQKVEEFGNRLDRVENLAKEIATRKTDSESDKKIFCISIMSFLDFSNALKGKFVSISDHTQS
jgi:hypothetical protein